MEVDVKCLLLATNGKEHTNIAILWAIDTNIIPCERCTNRDKSGKFFCMNFYQTVK